MINKFLFLWIWILNYLFIEYIKFELSKRFLTPFHVFWIGFNMRKDLEQIKYEDKLFWLLNFENLFFFEI